MARRDGNVLVPQSVRLSAVRTIIEAVSKSSNGTPSSQAAIAEKVGFATRKAGYAIAAARCLQLLNDNAVTDRGRQLLKLSAGSVDEAALFRKLIAESPHLRAYAATLLAPSPPDKQQLVRSIQSCTGFSLKTCQDRAATLLSWRKQVLARVEAQKTLFDPPEVVTAHAMDGNTLYAAGSATGGQARRKSKRRANSGSAGQISMLPACAQDPPDSLPKLVLPKRFETLEDEAKARSVDVTRVVEKVETAVARIETLLRRVRDGGTGQFEVFYGDTGIGKTAFLRTLSQFFRGLTITRIAKDEVGLQRVPDFIRQHRSVTLKSTSIFIYIVDERGNDSITRSEAENFFEGLRVLFREPNGRVLVIWPVTRKATRDVLAEVAWEIGGESIVSIDTRGAYEFQGLPKTRYYDVANLTAQNLTGETLETFGVTRAETDDILIKSSTIGSFFALLEERASSKRTQIWEILREKVKPKVWILVAGDDDRCLESTVARLSQGTKSRIDIERILTHLDDPKKRANYLTEWRARRQDAAYILRTLDVRILPVPPSVALAAIRGFGTAKIQHSLQKQSDRKESCCQTIMKSRLYKSIVEELGGTPQPHISGKPHGQKVADEYNRIQRSASVTDKPLNRALGKALEHALRKAGLNQNIIIEKRSLPGTNLQPDIQVIKENGEIICLEPTWRASGKGIPNEIPPRQNSMKPGNIQIYLLDKVYEYVKALGI